MQDVSNAWLAAQKLNFVPESFLEIVLDVTDPDATADATAEDNGHTVWSNVEQVADETEKDPPLLATLEHNLWVLDGTRAILPDDGDCGNAGYNGDEVSDENGEYTTTPTITLTFGSVYSELVPGLTITWGTAYEECAEDYRVTVYNGEDTVLQETVTGNTDVESVFLGSFSGYDKITIEVLKWAVPNRRARVENILCGVKMTYTKADIMNASHEIYVDPLSASLPKASFEFEMANADKTYNPENPEGMAVYLLERQMITVRYGYKLDGGTEWIKAGSFFLSEWDAPQNGITITFKARDALEFMTDEYTGSYEGTLYDIAEAAFTQAALPTLADGSERWYVDESLQDIASPVDESDEDATSDKLGLTGISIAKVLQMVANAACCVLYQDRNGVVRLEPLPSAMALVSGNVTDNGHTDWADVSNLADGTEKEAQKYYTAEHNIWTLDGTMTGRADETEDQDGFVSAEICDDDGAFTVNPKITIQFADLCRTTVPGVTIKWGSAYGECAESFTITAYNDSTAVATTTVTGNTLTDTYTALNMKYFNKVTVEVLAWSVPRRRARIENILVGIEYLRYEVNKDNSYSDSDITLSKQLKTVSVNSGQCTLPVSGTGETQTISNKLISGSQASTVAQWVADYLANRKTLSGTFRSDPRLDALDRIRNVNNFSESVLLVTDVQYTYNGAFRGTYEGRANV